MIDIPSWVHDVELSELPEQYRRFAELIGYENTLQLVANYGGDYQYIPKLDGLIKLTRDKQLWHDFRQGIEPRILAHRYDLSIVQVYEIIKRIKREAAVPATQISLFDAAVN
ncbi:MAG: Mor transcription activator family protein [Eubacteriales bacterium]|nr:Mor transcription activator family protein [Eubacteriales bacterium]